MWMMQIPDDALQDPYCTRFRLKGQFSAERTIIISVDRPAGIIRHGRLIEQTYAPIWVELMFGLEWNPTPSIGDSERIISVFADSPIPMGLKQLVITKTDGFIVKSTQTLPPYALNVSDVCVRRDYDQVKHWLFLNIDVIADQNIDNLFNKTCDSQRHVFWLVVPSLATQNRRQPASFGVYVEFGINHHIVS
jgi:hypothetical protein